MKLRRIQLFIELTLKSLKNSYFRTFFQRAASGPRALVCPRLISRQRLFKLGPVLRSRAGFSGLPLVSPRSHQASVEGKGPGDTQGAECAMGRVVSEGVARRCRVPVCSSCHAVRLQMMSHLQKPPASPFVLLPLAHFLSPSLSGHLSLRPPARLSATPPKKNVSHIKGAILSALEQKVSAHRPAARLNHRGRVEELDGATSPLPHFPPVSTLFHLLYLSGFLRLSLPSPLFLKNITEHLSGPAHPPRTLLAFSCLRRPPTACSHSHGEYVSRKYYHTKLKRRGPPRPPPTHTHTHTIPTSSISFLFIQHCITFPPSQPAN